MYKRHQQYTNSWIDPTHFTRVSIFRAIQYERERIMIAATRKQIEQDKFITISEGICWDLSFWVIPFIQLAQDRLKIWLSSSNQPSLSHVPLWTVLETPLSGPWTKMQRTTHVATLRYSYSALHRPHYAKKKHKVCFQVALRFTSMRLWWWHLHLSSFLPCVMWLGKSDCSCMAPTIVHWEILENWWDNQPSSSGDAKTPLLQRFHDIILQALNVSVHLATMIQKLP